MTEAGGSGATRRGPGRVTAAAAGLVVVLALGAVLWPRAETHLEAPSLLVFDPSGDDTRVAGVYGHLQEHLAAASGRELGLIVVRDLAAYGRELARTPAFVLAPDGLALAAGPGEYLPVASVRRPAPRNLRPSGVLVWRLAAGEEAAPWRSRRARTVCGDSLTLVASGALREAGLRRWPAGLACGPDPLDHAPVLHALRLGAFDYALVRQWDLDRFVAAGLLAAADFGVREVVPPVPDLVVLASRQLPRHVRLRCGETLAAVGRQSEDESPADRELRLALAAVHLSGFNLLLEPDFELVRRRFAGSWLDGAE
ncbi:hypothetical protein KDM41_01810 [bacterium]|nr:hypothetical protein [bacterium]